LDQGFKRPEWVTGSGSFHPLAKWLLIVPASLFREDVIQLAAHISLFR
jgi:hypothetical protein